MGQCAGTVGSLKGGGGFSSSMTKRKSPIRWQMIFQMQRYDVRVAYSAERAAELIRGVAPELAILDVILPAMNGIDLAIVIKENYPKCHVLLFSGHANTSMLLEEAGRERAQFRSAGEASDTRT